MQSRRVIATTLLALALGSTPSLAQSTEPLTQTLCVTFNAPASDVPWTAEAFTVAVYDETVLVTSVVPCAVPATGDSVFPDDYGLYSAFLSRQASAESRYNDLKDQVSAAIDDLKWGNVSKRSTTTANFLKKEVAWLDDNQPAACYEDAWQGYRDAWSMYRKAYTDVAYGAKHTSNSRIERAVDELGEANDLYDEIDLDAVTCEF